MKEAHELAKNGGYVTGFMYDKLAAIDPLGAFEILFFDPKWWQALGKSLGWGNSCHHFESKTWLSYRHQAKCGVGKSKWEIKWHDFIDHIASGGDVDEFFNKLIK